MQCITAPARRRDGDDLASSPALCMISASSLAQKTPGTGRDFEQEGI